VQTSAPSAPASAAEPTVEAEPAPPEPTVEELLAQLDELCGLEKVKKDVRSLINLIKIRKLRQENDLPVPEMSLHLVFMGNPGTGKTTVARLLAQLYKAIGVLPQGQLVEVDRSGLVAGFVGQTALKTQEVIQKALGGVLFIDEAYSLASSDSGNDFGQEAIDTILKAMEDHRSELVVIVAGYQGPMTRFLTSNPGLESRFNKYFYFEDYTGPQLDSIFNGLCAKNGYTPEAALKDYTPGFFQTLYEERDYNCGNARDVRNLFETLVSVQSDRVASLENPSREDLMLLTLADFRQAAGETEPPEGDVNAGLADVPAPALTLEGEEK
ncbi:MAG: AAA family ATPase, partial [Clostridiales bacterium]|nr:AAA family ATPase [Clostridiales bacterium]